MSRPAKHLAWFSCGAASAVAAKLTLEKYGSGALVVYCDTLASEHPDNRRFFEDVQRWLGREITVIRSAKYASIDEVFERTRYMAGPAGARCTVEMKKVPRLAFQHPNDTHVFGYTFEERKRANDFEERNPELAVEWPLVEGFVRKADCLRILKAAGIALPAMYALGYEHNNCLGCVKATSPGYWNKVRRDLPEVWGRRNKQSRLLGVRLARLTGDVRVFLDEVPLDADGPDGDIDCGPVCQMPLPGLARVRDE